MAPRRPQDREEARRLRREEGLALKRIAARLGVAVSTAHLWTKDIELTAEQRERNRTGPRAPHNPEWVAKRAKAWSDKNRRARLAYQAEGREHACARDPLHMAGCMLYWAEGAKGRNTIKFCNSDPEMIRFFAGFLGECLQVSPDRLRLRLHVYTGNGISLREIEEHWLRILGLPRSSLRKHALNPLPTSSSGRKPNRLPYGVCTLTVARSTREVQHIYGAIQEYARFEEPRWLDGPPRKPRKRNPKEQPQG